MIFYLLTFFIVFIVYSPWLALNRTLSSGDWPYLFAQNIQAFKIPTESPFLWLEPYYQITSKLGVQLFSLSWEATEKIFWFYPFLIISLLSSYFFLKYLSKQFKIDKEKSVIFISLGCLIFTTNTYILMLVGGGQMGVAMAYSLIPLILRTAFRIYEENLSLKKIILYSLVFGVQMMFDPRLFLLSILIAFLYFLFSFKKLSHKVIKRTILILALSLVMNLFWILPNLNFFNTEYTSGANALTASYLSFATFSNSIALLHPNWPENIFGKIGFMKPEFIAISILAFISLFFTKKNKSILFFAGLGIIGAFFAKGTNPPFGELYMWLSGIPGFMIFRDPTKFYTLVVLSYVVLIPFGLIKLSEKVLSIKQKAISIFAFSFLVFWIFLIKPAVFGNLTGTFKPQIVPQEYVNLKNFISNQNESFETLWVPQRERFGFSSRDNQAVSAEEFFEVSSISGVLNKFDNLNTKKQLEESNIRYIVVPDDFLKEIFITDRKYDEKLYIININKLGKVNWLSELENNNFGKIRVFEISKF